MIRTLSFVLLANLLSLIGVVGAAEPLLKPNDRVALLGGTFIERMQACGALEAALQTRRPDWQLRVRNLGWSGDDVHGIARKRFDSPADGFKRLLADVTTADPTVVLVAYGISEASDGPEAVQRFETGLAHLVDQLQQDQRRVILLPPVAMPGYRSESFPDLIDQCRQIVGRIGSEREIPVLDLDWQGGGDDVTSDGLLPSPSGYAKLAEGLARQLVSGPDDRSISAELSRQIIEKNQLFFHRYRPQNETYLFLFRKHEQGNNAVEIPQFDPLIDEADKAIWKLAR